jgi:hypothetical protein
LRKTSASISGKACRAGHPDHRAHKARSFIPSFALVYVLSVAIFALGLWDKAVTYNLEPPLVGLALRLILSNLVHLPHWLDAGSVWNFKTRIVLLGAKLPSRSSCGRDRRRSCRPRSSRHLPDDLLRRHQDPPPQKACGTLGAGGAVCGVSASIAIAGASAPRKGDGSISQLLSSGDRDDLRAALPRSFCICRRGAVAGTSDHAVFAYTLIKVVGRDVRSLRARHCRVAMGAHRNRTQGQPGGDLVALSKIRHRLFGRRCL